ncbi:hypothetical protein DET50_10863 [Marinobacter pelagius]|uniref:EAL domain-containing protein n=1 Tax=Marinobacter pelagius TaxID=379482 RepID=A0A366GR18_9GAMM|nr:hypothetical protein [Marinobacter pelagius]RBP30019.1 hypothetical protein DET50_10863 [Marinobacter pelagius]
MLRNSLVSTYRQSAGFPTFGIRNVGGLTRLRGRTIYTRQHQPAGYEFRVPDRSGTRSPVGEGLGYTLPDAQPDVHVYLAFLSRLVVACDRETSEVRDLMGEPSLQQGTFVLIQVSWFVVADARFQDSLVRAAGAIRKEGFRLKIAIDARELEDVRDLRLFRQALFQLEDEGIGVVLKNPQSGRDSPFAESVVYRAVPQLSVSPDWLGIGEDESRFDHSLYFERITLLNSAIHEDGKTVICEGVANEWQRSFLSSLPVSLFVFQGSRDDVTI